MEVKVLVTFAVPAEFAPWREMRQFQSQQVDGLSSYHALNADADVRVILTGMGSESARKAVGTAIRHWSPDSCISSGLAGGLKHAYRHGKILVPRKVVQVDERGLTGRWVRCHSALVALATESGAGSVDRFLTAPRIVRTSLGKKAMGEFGDAVEMESFAVLEVSQSHGLPAVAIRAISDTVEEDLPLDFNDLLHDDGRVRVGRMVRSLFRRPERVPGLVRFGRSSRQAATTLAGFLDRYVSSLAIQDLNLGPARAYAAI